MSQQIRSTRARNGTRNYTRRVYALIQEDVYERLEAVSLKHGLTHAECVRRFIDAGLSAADDDFLVQQDRK